MLIDFDRVLVDMEGKDIISKDEKPATVKGVTVEALLATFNDEQNLAGEEKLKRYELAYKINEGYRDMTAEDIVLIKKLVGKAYSPIIVGQAWKTLEGK